MIIIKKEKVAKFYQIILNFIKLIKLLFNKVENYN